ncbi:MAG: SDR family NAD(P)-dependent oxidoreductase [Chloroflexota bacterium]
MSRMQEVLDQFEGSLSIAIIGMAARFPGAENVGEFWQKLCVGEEMIHFFTDDELIAAGVPRAELDDRNYIKAAPILKDIEHFDARFFDYTPAEANFMDPQQRLLLECAWQTLEDAGYAGERASDAIGVYAGIKMNTYVGNFFAHPEQFGPESHMQVLMGNADFSLSTRISYKLNLKGPSYMLQTACSTSLAAVHLACQALLLDECRMALAGAVAVEVPHQVGYVYQYGGPASPDGHCRPFDAEAQGTVFGSGVAMVMLKRLEDALADGDHIYAVIRGSAVNNDGAIKASFTAPSVEGQTEVILNALACANASAESISYVEAHGTATPLGDPVEIAAITNAFRADTKRKGFCRIGSVKGNVGHLDAVAGMAGLIKTVLALQNKQIPASLNFTKPNPQIDFANSPFIVNTELIAWESGAFPRRAGVSSFGFGGTNTHVVLEEAPATTASESGRAWQLLALSAKTAGALDAAAAQMAAHLAAHPETNLSDAAYTLQTGRRAFQHRRAAICRDTSDAAQLLARPNDPRLLSGVQENGDRPLAFMFPGQGAQYVHMGRDLYQAEPVFRQWVDHCAQCLLPHLGFDLRSVLYPDAAGEEAATKKLGQTAVTQPALFMIEYALARLWQSWGLQPQALVGHSIGEYVAACLAGVFSLEDALGLVATRGHLMQQLPAGSMLSVALPERDVMPLLKGMPLSLAANNAPALCVISGPNEAVALLHAQLTAKSIQCRLLHTSHAFHSGMMAPIVETFTEAFKGIRLHAPQIPYLSNLSGAWIEPEEATRPRYWAEHLVRAVRFCESVATLLQDSNRILLEVGPGQALSALARQQLEDRPEVAVLSSMRHPQHAQPDDAYLLGTLGKLWLLGQRVDWHGFHAQERRQRIPLPTYPFERKRYWVNTSSTTTAPAAPGKKNDIHEWFYLPSWRQTMLPDAWDAASAAENRASWLVFSDAGRLSAQIIQQLQDAGQQVTCVLAGTEFARQDGSTYTLRPQQREDYEMLLDALLAANRLPQKIVHLWLVPTCERDGGPAPASYYQALGFGSLLTLAQALAAKNITGPLHLGLVSKKMQTILAETDSQPEKSTVLGPCRVIPQEYPHITCSSIDIETDNGEALTGHLVAEMLAPGPEPIVAYRQGQRWVQAVERVNLKETSRRAPAFRTGGVYWITGGLGGLGLAIAEHLARTAQAKLVLTGRSDFPEREAWQEWLSAHQEQEQTGRIIRKLLAMEELGAEVLVARADVSDRQQMRAAAAQARRRFGSIHGVFHTAGVAGGGLIQLKTLEAATAVLAPKVQGALVLAEIFEKQSLDFMLFFSSLSALLGEFGQADYCAANAFLDAFARSQSCRHAGRFISVNWDTWREIGMATHTEVPDALREWRAAQLEAAVTPREGIEVLERILLRCTAPQIAICTTDFDERLADLRAMTQANILESLEKLTPNSENQPRPELETPYLAPANKLEREIAEIWQNTLGIEKVGVNDNFFELGGHSLLALRIIGRLREAFQVDVSVEHLFGGPTVSETASVIAGLQQNQDNQDALEILQMLDRLSDEDIALDTVLPASTAPAEAGGEQTTPTPMTQAPRRLEYSLIIPHPGTPRLLVIRQEAGWALPSLSPTQHHFGAVAELPEYARSRLGMQISVLRCIDYRYDAAMRSVQAIYTTENRGPDRLAGTDTDMRWVDGEAFAALPLPSAEQQKAVAAWLSETQNGQLPQERRPWARSGWFEEATAWIDEKLAAAGMERRGSIEQIRVWGVSCVLRVMTGNGRLYFRAVPAKSAHEPLLLQALAQHYPHHVPKLLAVDPQRRWVLMHEVQGQPLFQVANLHLWEEALRTFAQIQVELAQQAETLLAWGSPDRRIERLPAQLEAMLADTPTLQRGRFGGLANSEIEQLHALGPAIKARCRQLAACPIPASLEHGDFHPGNIYQASEGPVFFDWGESSLSHPFFSFNALEYQIEHVLPDMRRERGRLLSAYLEPWLAYASAQQLAEIVEISRPLAALHAAINFYQLITSLEADARWEMEAESALPFSLRMALKAINDSLQGYQR